MKKRGVKILFYPQQPSEYTTIYKLIKLLNYEMVNNPQQMHDVAIYWEDTTFRKKHKIINDSKIINADCNDISKKKVEQIFKNVFKYSTLIDPTIYKGKCVKKSNLNAKHDGQIINCPIESPESDSVYQKLINNENIDWGIYDIRVPIINQAIPFVLIKCKAKIKRFKDCFITSFIQETHVIFNNRELDNIIKFCKELGLEYGEIDILRDSNDKNIYIIDANNTPWWCPSITQTESNYALSRLASTFEKEFGIFYREGFL